MLIRLQIVLEFLKFEHRSQKVSLYSLGIDLARERFGFEIYLVLALLFNFMFLNDLGLGLQKPSRDPSLQQFYLMLFDEWWQYF